jgi:hypothetical protein
MRTTENIYKKQTIISSFKNLCTNQDHLQRIENLKQSFQGLPKPSAKKWLYKPAMWCMDF